MHRWVEVSIKITPATEEAITNTFWDLGSNGVIQSGGELSGVTEYVTGYWPDYSGLSEKLDQIYILWEELKVLGLAYGDCRIKTRQIREKDWSKKWKQLIEPVKVSDTLIVAPPWSEISRNDGDNLVWINPGTGFGTGGHETTQLCLKQLEKRIRLGDRVLDIGSGSGVLSIAAAILGASQVIGIDLDSETIGNATENIQLNSVADRVEVYAGNVDHPAVIGSYRIIVSNIDANSLSSLLSAFIHRLQPCGILILSGLLILEAQSFETTLRNHGFTVIDSETQGEWWAGVAKLTFR